MSMRNVSSGVGGVSGGGVGGRVVAKGHTILLTGPAGSSSQLLLSRSMTPYLPVVLVVSQVYNYSFYN